MSREWDEARLREAFAALAESETGGEVDTMRVWKAAAGDLPAEERREVIERMALDPGYAEAWRLAVELLRASGDRRETPEDASASSTKRRRFWHHPYFLAAAAVLLVGVLGIYLPNVLAPTEPIFRGGPIQSLVSGDRTLPRDDFRLRWQAPQGARFDVRVTTEDLRVIDTASGLEASEYVVPAESLADLESGATIFWQVDATLSDGATVQSETFVVTLQ